MFQKDLPCRPVSIETIHAPDIGNIHRHQRAVDDPADTAFGGFPAFHQDSGGLEFQEDRAVCGQFCGGGADPFSGIGIVCHDLRDQVQQDLCHVTGMLQEKFAVAGFKILQLEFWEQGSQRLEQGFIQALPEGNGIGGEGVQSIFRFSGDQLVQRSGKRLVPGMREEQLERNRKLFNFLLLCLHDLPAFFRFRAVCGVRSVSFLCR